MIKEFLKGFGYGFGKILGMSAGVFTMYCVASEMKQKNEDEKKDLSKEIEE